jgi:ribonuclease HI
MLKIFTDGSAIRNPGPGGWGVVILEGKKRRELSGSNPWTTISEMEVVAAVEALRSLHGTQRVLLHSDSRYLIDGMTHLVQRWQRFGWKNSRGAPIQNRESWTDLLALSHQHRIDCKWVQGHRGQPFQGRADVLAYRAARISSSMHRLAA